MGCNISKASCSRRQKQLESPENALTCSLSHLSRQSTIDPQLIEWRKQHLSVVSEEFSDRYSSDRSRYHFIKQDSRNKTCLNFDLEGHSDDIRDRQRTDDSNVLDLSQETSFDERYRSYDEFGPENLEKGLFATHATIPHKRFSKKFICKSVCSQLKESSSIDNVSRLCHRFGESEGFISERKSSCMDFNGNDLFLDPEVIESLKQSPLFSELSDSDLEEIVHSMIPVKCAAGQFLLTEGEESDLFFIVASGSFLLLRYKNGKATPRFHTNESDLFFSPGNSHTIFRPKDERLCTVELGESVIPVKILCGRGACFGDANLILHGYASARTVVCAEDESVVYCIARNSFRKKLAEIMERRQCAMISSLRSIADFSSLHEEQLKLIASMITEEEYEKRTQILYDRDSGPAMYILCRGAAQVKHIFPHISRNCVEEPILGVGQSVLLDNDNVIVMALDHIVTYKVYMSSIEKYIGPLRKCKERSSYMSTLSKIPLLRELGYKQLDRLIDMMKKKKYYPGEDIVREGDPSYTMYLLIEGDITVIARNPESGEMEEVAELHSIDYFGEGALQDVDPRNATVTTKRGAVCLELHRDDFSSICPSIAKSRHIRSSKLWSEPMSRHPGEMKPLSVIKDGHFGRTVLVDVNCPRSPSESPGGSPKRERYWTPARSNTRRIVRNVAGKKGENLKNTHLSAGHHPFIVNLMGWFVDFPFNSVVLEYLEGGSLERLIREQPRECRTGSRYYSAAILSALAHLHERGVVFRGLRPKAVLLDWSGQPRLADFTLAHELKSGRLYTLCGGLGYTAPEVLLGHGYDWVADYWSLGCLIYELFSGKAPFIDPCHSTDPMVMLKKAMNADIDCNVEIISPMTEYNGLFVDESLSELDWQDLVFALLQPKPWQRRGFNRGFVDIANSKWFDGFSWDDLLNRRIPPPWAPLRKNHSRSRGRTNRVRSSQRHLNRSSSSFSNNRDTVTPPISPHHSVHKIRTY